MISAELSPDFTTPDPLPAFVTEMLCWVSVNVAVTLVACAIVTVHVVRLPLQPPPLQLVNVEPVAGVAVSVTIEP